jgi:phosphatidylinositol glycan class A protein
MVSVIPNAVDTAKFQPDPALRSSMVTIVVMSRLVYRKGVDFLIDVIPEICRRFPAVRFVIGGDGPKRLALEEMRERFQLHERVSLLGAVPHEHVRDVLTTGHIFLNCSLTEAFCMAIVEAASCGLLVVSTRIGGVPEVLPDDMISLADPNPQALIDALAHAIGVAREAAPSVRHAAVRAMYDWGDIAARTERVFDAVALTDPPPLIERLRRYYGCGAWAGKLFCFLVAVDFLLWCLIQWLRPRDQIDQAPDFGYDAYCSLSQGGKGDDDQVGGSGLRPPPAPTFTPPL